MKYRLFIKMVAAALWIFVTVFAVVIIYAAMIADSHSVFGHRLYIIETGSMEPKISVGELIIVKDVKKSDLKIGDIITFTSNDPEIRGKNNTHKIERIDPKDDSVFYTRGEANPLEDKYPVNFSDIKGKVIYHSAFFGSVIRFFMNPVYMLLLIVIPIIAFSFIDIKKQIRKIRELSKIHAENGKRTVKSRFFRLIVKIIDKSENGLNKFIDFIMVHIFRQTPPPTPEEIEERNARLLKIIEMDAWDMIKKRAEENQNKK